MKRNIIIYAACIALLILALVLRLPKLAQRPMHTDEAVHAIKFGELLEHNQYRYDPFDYHGPTLNYFTLIPAWLSGQRHLAAITETTLRLVPVWWGTIIIIAIFLLAPWFRTSALIWMGLFTAISPAMVYYSRYYIMEIILIVCAFIWFVSCIRYWHTPRIRWLIIGAISLGMMIATKETWIINVFAAGVASGFMFISHKNEWVSIHGRILKISGRHLFLGAIITIATVVLFFSSFGANPNGIFDALRAYPTYLSRARGEATVHEQPWYYYAHLLLWYKIGANFWWSEAVILIFAGMGVAHAFLHSSQTSKISQWIFWYALVIAIIYSAIPYKTPWNLLNFWQPVLLLAGFGFDSCFHVSTARLKRLLILLGLIGMLHLGWQSWQANFTHAATPGNPYVYGHTSPDVFKIVDAVHEASTAAQGNTTCIEIICSNDDYWPLPWYFRTYSHVGYWNLVSLTAPAAPIIIISPDLEPVLMKKLYNIPEPGERHLYVPLIRSYTQLRPGVELRSYVRKDLWDKMP